MTFDLYVWASPRDLDVDRAEALIEGWQAAGGDPSEARSSRVRMSDGFTGSS